VSEQLHTVDWGNHTIAFVVQRANRKRVAIEVNPDSSVLVRAPMSAELSPVLAVVKKKAPWILRQQRYFQQFIPRTPPRSYVSGESHLYLGRRYRLKVHAVDAEEEVKLSGGYLHVCCRNAGDATRKQVLLEAWYRKRANLVFEDSLLRCLDHRAFRSLPPPGITIRKMRKRWGSCTAAGRVVLNLDLIRAPRACIDYVVTHELCHLLVPDHSRQFTSLLSRVMPDWQVRKERLERVLS